MKSISGCSVKNINGRDAWVAQSQSVKCLTSAQVMISRFARWSPASGSGLNAWSVESASDSVPPSLSALPAHSLSLSLSLSKINKYFKNVKKKNINGRSFKN